MLTYMSKSRLIAAVSAAATLRLALFAHVDIGPRTSICLAVFWALVALAPRDIKS